MIKLFLKILFLLLLLTSCKSTDSLSFDNKIYLLFNNYYYEYSAVKYKYFKYSDMSSGNSKINLEEYLEGMDEIFENIVLKLNEIGFHYLNIDKIDFILIHLDYENPYYNFIEQSHTGVANPYIRYVLLLNIQSVPDNIALHANMPNDEIYTLYKETIIHEFSHTLLSIKFKHSLLDEGFADFISYRFFNIREEANKEDLKSIKTNTIKNNHTKNSVLNSDNFYAIITSSDLTLLLKEDLLGLFLSYIYDFDDPSRLETLTHYSNLEEVRIFRDRKLYRDFTIWLQSNN